MKGNHVMNAQSLFRTTNTTFWVLFKVFTAHFTPLRRTPEYIEKLRKATQHYWDNVTQEEKDKRCAFLRGRKFSKETKEKIRQKAIGRKVSSETRKKMSASKMGEKNHFYGKTHTEETKLRVGKSSRGRNVGEKGHNWQGGVSKINKSEREFAWHTWEYQNWRRLVFKRDNFTCQICKTRGGKLHIDHIKSWRNYPKLRYTLSNGRVLCVPCHKTTTSYGRPLKLSTQGFTLTDDNVL